MEIAGILNSISCEDYNFVAQEQGGVHWFYAYYEEADVETGLIEKQVTRSWIIPADADEDAITRTVLLCLLTSHEHRVREHFLYKGKRIFDPHKKVTNEPVEDSSLA